MATVIHLFRSKLRESLFKEILLESIASNAGDGAYICSGYFGEYPTFSASAESSKCGSLFTIKSKIDNFDLHIYGCKGVTSMQIKFCDNLARAGYNILERKRKGNFHAKIFILYKNNENNENKDEIPLLEIIGSSNMTGPAYGTRCSTFNYEADLVIINEPSLERKIQSHLSNFESSGITYYKYDEENNKDKKIEETMKEFLNELKENFKKAKTI